MRVCPPPVGPSRALSPAPWPPSAPERRLLLRLDARPADHVPLGSRELAFKGSEEIFKGLCTSAGGTARGAWRRHVAAAHRHRLCGKDNVIALHADKGWLWGCMSSRGSSDRYRKAGRAATRQPAAMPTATAAHAPANPVQWQHDPTSCETL